MRLVCPNCGAQYEVPDDVIPQGGRDVQCSNCGHTWFQVHPDQDPGLAEDLEEAPAQDDFDDTMDEPAAPPDTRPIWDEADDDLPLSDDLRPEANDTWDEDEEGEVTPPWETQDVTPAQDVPAPPVEDYEDDYESWDEEAPAATEPRRNLDPNVADLLREEAEREARQRAAERGGLETQPELGLTQSDEDESTRRQREAQERMARLRGEPAPADADTRQEAEAAAMSAAAAEAAASRRDLLPDIDEINSTLRSTSDRRPASAAGDHETPGPALAAAPETRPGGFRRGFSIVVLLMVLAIALYVLAPRLAEMVPALRGPLAAYVEVMNGLRLWIDEQLRGVLGWLDSMSDQG